MLFFISESPTPKTAATKQSEGAADDITRRASTTLYSTAILQQGPKDQLITAREILDRALQGMSYSRQAVAETDGTSIADVSWVRVCHNLVIILYKFPPPPQKKYDCFLLKFKNSIFLNAHLRIQNCFRQIQACMVIPKFTQLRYVCLL